MNYRKIEKDIIELLEKTPFCTLASSNKKGIVSTAQMSLINDGLTVYLQTDKTFEKVKNIMENPNVALNIGPFAFKGTAKVLGHPSNNKIFVEKLKLKHLSTYNSYTNLPNEVLIKIILTEVKIWKANENKQETITIVNFKNKQIKTIICDKL